MWKSEHRLAADRRGLRYPSDLTDAEWAIVEPMIPPARHGGRKRSVNVREVLHGISTSCGPVANGRRCRRTCRRRARCTTIWTCGTGTARWNASTMRSTSPCASRKEERPRGGTQQALHTRPSAGPEVTGQLGGNRAVMLDLLRSVVDEGPGKAARLANTPVAGKTGTTQHYRDAWFVAFTSSLIVGVWAGNDENSPMNKVVGATCRL
jgi:transposase